MARIAQKDVEILVHTTARSRGVDDARYRALAQAYLEFQPARRRRVEEEPQNNATEELEREAGSQLQNELRDSTQEERDSQASFRPDDGDSGAEEELYSYKPGDQLSFSHPLHSPSLSFNSAVDNADSPAFRARITHLADVPAIQRSQGQEPNIWIAPPSVIADSQPEESNTMIVFCSPTRMLELYLQGQESQGTGSTPDISIPEQRNKSSSLELPPGRRGGLSSSPENNRNKSRNLELPTGLRGGPTSSPENILTQSSPSPVKGLGRRLELNLEARNANPPSTQDPQFDLKRKWVSSSSEESQPTSAPSKTAALSTPSVQYPMSRQLLPARPEKRARVESTTSLLVASSQPIPSSRKPDSSSTTNSFTTPSTRIWANKLEIRPNLPNTSTQELTAEMLVTPYLKSFLQKIPVKLHPRPVFQKRPVRDMERGYWLVDCKDWREGLRYSCWEELGNFIGNDRAGWGVWCIRDEEFTSFRIYCWGIVAGEVFLLLYMASWRRIGKAGLRWIGGDGETILQMAS